MGTSLTSLLEQEELLQFDRFSNEDALSLGQLLISLAKNEHGCGIAIHIERNGVVLFSYLMEGTARENQHWIRVKKAITDYFDHSSYYVGQKFKEEGTTVNDAVHLDPGSYQAVGGCFPIRVRGTGVVGTISISGISSEGDHNALVKALTVFLKK